MPTKRKFKHVKVFGMLTDGISGHLLDDTAAMWVNAYYDLKYAPGKGNPKHPVYAAYVKYLETHQLEGTDILDLAAMPAHRAEAERTARLLWYLTSEDFRFSNRYQTEMYGIYQRYAGKFGSFMRWSTAAGAPTAASSATGTPAPSG